MKKKYRLLKNEDFKSVMDSKKYFTNQSFSLHYKDSELNQLRIGISVSRKLGGAVKRNLIKRQVRMMCMATFDLQMPRDFVLLVRKGYLERKYQENAEELKKLYEKAKRGEKQDEII